MNAAQQALLETGLEHLALGRSLLPINASKMPHMAALLKTGHMVGQNASWKPLMEHRPTADMLRVWLEQPQTGLGLVCGGISRLVIIDADGEKGIRLFNDWGLTERAHVRTRSGGLHWYVRHPGWRVRTLQSQTNAKLAAIQGVDIRADGGYAVTAPTAFGSMRYVPLRDHHELDCPSLLPPHVQDLLGLAAPPSDEPVPFRARGYVPQKSESLAETLLQRALTKAHEGEGRNAAGFWLATQLRDNDFSQGEAQAYMHNYASLVPAHNAKGEREDYPLSEALTSLRQAYLKPARAPWKKRERGPKLPEPKPHALPPLTRLVSAWPVLSDDDRYYAMRCLHGCEGETGRSARKLFESIAPTLLQQAAVQKLSLTHLLLLLDRKKH
ncbi:bifunctional DNA primase/polymerase [Deinococcus ficus]|uniref:bifunctional DNA primase/polymerase n=1 Tax=Deinococcus ficus TaxID=317577 RepID=UPI00041A617A|nr:bifunctional DNA primase/polymerase [Deinococcus ficus]